MTRSIAILSDLRGEIRRYQLGSAMSEDTPSKLEDIETQWSVVRRAHHDAMKSSDDARRFLVMRYSASIRRFVRFMTRDEDDADDISQDAIMRLLKGDFAGADPEQGRFRDFLRTALRNMVRNHWAKSARRLKHRDSIAQERRSGNEVDVEADWITCWRTNLLDVVWARLQDFESKHSENRFHAILKLRVDQPDWTYQQLSDYLSERGIGIRPATLRQQVHRARIKYAELVVDEVMQGLDPATPERIEDELITLGLYERIKDVLPINCNAKR